MQAPRNANAPAGIQGFAKNRNFRAERFYRPRRYTRKRRPFARRTKRILVSLFCRLPAALWPLAGAIARTFWPSFGRA